jgi:hypothetical protein
MRAVSRVIRHVARVGAAHRGLAIALAAATVLVFARSFVYLAYEQSFFDSDQAIFGLMAKHLLEGRAFPLYCYGQTYMLAVDAWVAAPFFLLFGPSVMSWHLSMVALNLATVVLLITILYRESGLTPPFALLATLVLAFTPPLTAASLVEGAAGIGPVLCVPILWLLRRRPLWFGLVLAVGSLSRPFTAYVVPVLLVQQFWDRSLWRRDTLRFWLVAAVVFAAVVQSVKALEPYSDLMGPGTRGELIGGYGGSQVGTVADRIEFIPSELPVRVETMIADDLPGLYGLAPIDNAIARQGHAWALWPVVLACGIGLAAAAVAVMRSRSGHAQPGAPQAALGASRPLAFPVFLLGVGLLAVLVYIITRPPDLVVHRYLLLSLYVPVGVVSLVFAAPTVRWVQGLVAAAVVLAGIGSGVDHWRQVERYWGGKQPNDLRVLADELVRRHIHVAMAGYWRAYKITFLTDEQVKVASSDVVRISEYQRLANAEGPNLITIQDEPCPGGDHVSAWYLCKASPSRMGQVLNRRTSETSVVNGHGVSPPVAVVRQLKT